MSRLPFKEALGTLWAEESQYWRGEGPRHPLRHLDLLRVAGFAMPAYHLFGGIQTLLHVERPDHLGFLFA